MVRELDRRHGDGSLIASREERGFGMGESDGADDDTCYEEKSDPLSPRDAPPKEKERREDCDEEKEGEWQNQSRKEHSSHREQEEDEGKTNNPVSEYEKGVIGDERENSFTHNGMVAVFYFFFHP